jgi:ribosomal protein S18 acetylase RimI-like enzyme
MNAKAPLTHTPVRTHASAHARVRAIRAGELEELLALYRFLNPEDPEVAVDEKLRDHWQQILSDPNLYYLVIEEDGKLVSSCAMAIIKNLTRSARPYGLIENVVTHEDYRRRGYGTALLKKAVEIAEERNCYKVMLMTGRKNESTLRFYERAGFDRGEKTAFIIRLDHV